MNILLITPFLPYPGVSHAGGKLVYHLLSTLSRNHEVTLVTRVFPGEERQVEFLRARVAGIEAVAADGPMVPGSLRSLLRTILSYRHMARKALEVLRRGRFDICQVEHTEAAIFFRPPKGLPAALTLHDVKAKPAFRRYELGQGVSRWFHWLVWSLTRVFEGRAASSFKMVLTLSDVDRDWADRTYPGMSLRVLRYPAGLEFRGLPRAEVPGRLLFVGALNRPENVDAIRYLLGHVWPAVRNRHPGAEWWVVGGGMDAELRKVLETDSRIHVTGRVESVEEYYASAAVFVAPILAGGGVIVKIQDALAAGVPVVTTTFGNEGIAAKEGEEILVSDGPEEFRSGVLSLLEDPLLRRTVGDAGKRFVRDHFSEEGFRETLESAYNSLR
jgi:glycosyltransferase involved in cell wall biosynthesis